MRYVILGMASPSTSALRDWAARHEVAAEDLERFATMALELLLNLSEGAAARYRVRPSEYAEWRSRYATQ